MEYAHPHMHKAGGLTDTWMRGRQSPGEKEREGYPSQKGQQVKRPRG